MIIRKGQARTTAPRSAPSGAFENGDGEQCGDVFRCEDGAMVASDESRLDREGAP